MESNIYKEAKRIINEVPEIISVDNEYSQKVINSDLFDSFEYTRENRLHFIEETLGRKLNEEEMQWYIEGLDVEPIEMFRYTIDQAKREGRTPGHKFEELDKLKSPIIDMGFVKQLVNSLRYSQKNLTMDNPFLNVKGSYNFFIDTSKGGTEKIDYIHKKITDYLVEKYNKPFFFKPGDNSKIYVPNEPHSYQVAKMIKDAPNELKKLVTQYPQTKKSKVTIKISTDPLDIVKKSTKQSWKSCEAVGDIYCQGIFSDIENNNAIAYIYLDDSQKPTGRFMLRWCEKEDEVTGEKKKDIGIEPIMYPRTSYALEVYELIRGIIESKGYGTYDDCKTPYRYTGYSDYIGGSGEITYHSGAGSQVLIQYASLPDISRNLTLALAEHTTPVEVRRALAENSAICDIEDAVIKISKDIDDDTKKNLIITCSGMDWDEREKKLPIVAIENLINDSSEDIRAVAASRVNLTPEQVRKLSNDKEIYVKLELIRNKAIKCCQDVIDKLALDGSNDVSDELIRKYGEDLSPKIIQRIVDYGKEDSLLYIDNLNKYPEIVRKLASGVNKQVVASKEYITCCPDVIDNLADSNETIAVQLLENPAAQHKHNYVMNRLKDIINTTKNYSVAPIIARQPDICDYEGLIDNLVKYVDDTTKYINDSSRRQVEEKLAENLSISCRPDIIKKISDSMNSESIQLLASNPALKSSPETIEKLWYSETPFETLHKNRLVTNPALEYTPKLLKEILENTIYTAKDSYLTTKLASNPVVLKRRDLSEDFIQQNKPAIIEENKDVFKHEDLMKEAMSSFDLVERLSNNSYIINHPEVVNKLYDTITNFKFKIGTMAEDAIDSYKRAALRDFGRTLKYMGALDQDILKREPIKGWSTVSGDKEIYKQKYKDIIDKIEAYIGHPIYA